MGRPSTFAPEVAGGYGGTGPRLPHARITFLPSGTTAMVNRSVVYVGCASWRMKRKTLGLADVLGREGLDDLDDLVLLAAGQPSHLLEDLAEPAARSAVALGSGLGRSNRPRRILASRYPDGRWCFSTVPLDSCGKIAIAHCG